MRRSPIGFAMAILFRDASHQFVERVLAAAGAQDDASVGAQVERQAVALGQAGVFDDSSRNPDGQTIPPFRNLRVVWHAALH